MNGKANEQTGGTKNAQLERGASAELPVISGKVLPPVDSENEEREEVSKRAEEDRGNDHVPLRTCTDCRPLSISPQGFES